MQRRIVTIDTHPIHISMEEQFWECLEDIAITRGTSLSTLIDDVAKELGGELSSALRVYALSYYQLQLGTEQAASPRVFH